MPRKMLAAAAGRYQQDNIAVGIPGRGSIINRAATLAALANTVLQEYLFEGGDPTYRIADVNGQTLVNSGGSPVQAQQPLSFASVDSILYPVALQYDQQTAGPFPGATAYAWEMWFQSPDYAHNRATHAFRITILSAANNKHQMVGAYTQSGVVRNFPTALNTFNGDIEWQSFKDFYGDGLPHQLLELHELGDRNNYIVVLDGIPIASGTNGGQIQKFDGTGFSLNGKNDTAVGEQAGCYFGSYHIYNNNAELTLQDARELFETSAALGHDMLTLPQFIALDSENITLDITRATIDMGAVLDSTGVRSGAIPRDTQKRYFEFEIIDEGSNTNAVRVGIRRMITIADVGDFIDGGQDGQLHNIYVQGNDILFDVGQDTGVDVSPTTTLMRTGTIIMVAIDWKQGKVWMGRDGVWQDNGADPAGGTGQLLQLIERDTNWAAHVWNNGAANSARVRLKTKWYEMTYTPPVGWQTWVIKPFEVEPEVNGPNRRLAVLDSFSAELDREYLMKVETDAGVVVDSQTHDVLGVNQTLYNSPSYAGDSLSYARAGGVNWGTNRAMQQPSVNTNGHAFELWWRSADTGQAKHGVINASNNQNEVLGRVLSSINYPAARNNFNGDLHWNSELDWWGDPVFHAGAHQLMEIHEVAQGANFIATLDGIPIAAGSNEGWMKITGGYEINGDCAVADSQRSQGDYGGLSFWRGGEPLTLYDVRRLYEASVINKFAQAAAGMESGAILDAQITSNGEDTTYTAIKSRLNGAQAWGPQNPPAIGDYLQIDLGSIQTVEGIQTQGAGDFGQYTTSYDLHYSDDDIGYTPFAGNTLTGNTDNTSVVENLFGAQSFSARYIRIHPQTWSGYAFIRTEILVSEDTGKARDMLSSPSWAVYDSDNCTTAGTIKRDLTLGDVNNNTGCRSYAIPRRGKVYFEVYITAQGDSVNGTLVGLCKLASKIDVGTYFYSGNDEFNGDSYLVLNVQIFNPDISQMAGTQGGAGTPVTGHTIMFAIDWDTGNWWVGDADDNEWVGVGGFGDPENGTNPLTPLDIETNWAVRACPNGASGNGQVQLRGDVNQMLRTPPVGFSGWVEALASYDNKVLADEPIGYWKLDETAGTTIVDEINGNDGGLLGGYTLNQSPVIVEGGRSIDFDGVDGTLAVIGNNAILEIAGDVTMEVWVDLAGPINAVNSEYILAFAQPTDSQNDNYLYSINIQAVTGILGAFHEHDAGVNDQVWSTHALTLGIHHLVVVRDIIAKTYTFWDDGIKVDTVVYATNPNGGLLSALRFGMNGQSTNGPDMRLDNVAIYNKQLPDARILNHSLAGGPLVDPLYADVVLLLRSDALILPALPQGTSNFIDESNVGRTLTRNSTPAYNNGQSIFGNGFSIIFAGDGNDWIEMPDSPDLGLEDRTVEFCLEAWIYVTQDGPNNNNIMGGRDNSSSEEFTWGVTGTSPNMNVNFNLWSPNFGIATAAGSIQLNTWHHVAVTRENVAGDGLMTMYVDGLQSGTPGTQVSNTATNTGVYYIGHNAFNNTRDFGGFIDSVRFTRNQVRYTADFPVPFHNFRIQ